MTRILAAACALVVTAATAASGQPTSKPPTPVWSFVPMPVFPVPVLSVATPDTSQQQIEARWKELTFATAVQVNQAYRLAFVESVRAHFDLLQARGLLEAANPQGVIDRVLEPFKAAEQQWSSNAEVKREEARTRAATVDLLRERLARLDALQQRLDEQARSDQFLSALRSIRESPPPVRCTSTVLGSIIQTNCQ